jgi:hypothetical protein
MRLRNPDVGKVTETATRVPKGTGGLLDQQGQSANIKII